MNLILLIKKSFLIEFIILIILLSACSERNSNDPLNSKEATDNITIQEREKIINQNPYLTDKYLEKRKKNEKYTYFIIDTLHIKNAVILIYKKENLQLDMITTENELFEIDFEIVTPWDLLSKDQFYLQGLGGLHHPFLTDHITREHPHLDIDHERDSYDLTESYSVLPLAQEEFLFVIIDEATYMMTEAVDFNTPITAHILGLPIKMAYPLDED